MQSSIDKTRLTVPPFGQPSCDRVGSTTLYSLLANLTATSRASAETLAPSVPYKALVCLFLDGGNDSFNMLVPFEPVEYARYQAVRTNLALDKEHLLEIGDPRGTGRRFGVHSAMPEVRDLYAQGKLSFVCNVGTLAEPTTLAGVNDLTARLPLGLYSHADQSMHWQTATPDLRGSAGWGGRIAEILQAVNEREAVSMNISLSGTNIFQSGRNLVPYSITPEGASLLEGYTDPARPFFRKAVDSMLELKYQNLLKQTYSKLTRDSIDAAAKFFCAWNKTAPLTTVFPDTLVGKSLRGVAQGIAARDNLGMRRQTFFARSGGWDHHDEVLTTQAVMLRQTSEALGAFWRAMGELGMQDNVVLFTVSDFGRTLSSNGRGTDHGWGGNQLVLGGNHAGGRLYGRYPDDLSFGNPLDTGRGRLIPTMSVDEYFCELALWLGVASVDIPYILPNIGRFCDSAKAPLGIW